VFNKALSENFKEVEVRITDCPDLTHPPYSLASPGLGGRSAIADIGGVLNMEFLKNNNIFHYDLNQIAKTTNLPFFIGAGATKPSLAADKDNSEWIPNANVVSGRFLSKEGYVDKTGACCQADYPSPEFSSLCNLFCSEGTPHTKVLFVKAHVRTGSQNIISCIRLALAKYYPEKQVGFGGAFIIKKGKFKSHVMPGFPPCDVFGKDIPWLKFYEVEAPVTCLSVFMNLDLHDDGARLEHTHFFSTRNDAGHYHYDLTPDTVEYEGYFTLADKFYRIDRAEKPQD